VRACVQLIETEEQYFITLNLMATNGWDPTRSRSQFTSATPFLFPVAQSLERVIGPVSVVRDMVARGKLGTFIQDEITNELSAVEEMVEDGMCPSSLLPHDYMNSCMHALM